MNDRWWVAGFWVAIVGYLAGLIGFNLLNWAGDPCPERIRLVGSVFTDEQIRAGFAYHRAGFWLRVIAPPVTLGALLWLLREGRSWRLAETAIAWAGGRFWAGSLLFAAAFALGMALLRLPFAAWRTLVIERGFGFSPLTIGGFAWLWLRQVAVAVVIEAAVATLMLSILRGFPRAWVIGLPVVMTGVSVAMIVLTPYVITPLFYRITPLQPGPLSDAIATVANRAGIDVAGIQTIDASRYTRHTNAYFTGFGRQKWIMLYDTLIESHTVPESAMIFAHEAGHWRHDHMRIGMTLGFFGALAGAALLYLLWPQWQKIPGANIGDLAHPGAIPLLTLLATVGSFYTAPVEAQISQHFERQADAAAIELTGDPCTYVSAEVRLAGDNHSLLLPHPWVTWWFASHPPAIDRVTAGLDWVRTHLVPWIDRCTWRPDAPAEDLPDGAAPAPMAVGRDTLRQAWAATLAQAPSDRLRLLRASGGVATTSPTTTGTAATGAATAASRLDRFIRARLEPPVGAAWPAGDLAWLALSPEFVAAIETRVRAVADAPSDNQADESR